jgi:hypothetical protein
MGLSSRENLRFDPLVSSRQRKRGSGSWGILAIEAENKAMNDYFTVSELARHFKVDPKTI